MWQIALFAPLIDCSINGEFNALIAAAVIAVTWPVHNRIKLLYESIGIKHKEAADNTNK